MRRIKYDYYVGDFETTVYKGQEFTEVWASALVKFNTEDVIILHSIDETFEYLKSLNKNICVYYHNLKFDGSFWLSYLITQLHYKQALLKTGEREIDVQWLDTSEMKKNTFRYSISSKGAWYSITIRTDKHYIELRDSLKLLPFSVKKIGKSFGTKHKKLDMEYEGFRYAGCEITDKEKEYIANDVLVVKEALEIMFEEGHKRLTIGSCCLAEYKHSLGLPEFYDQMFPDMYEETIDEKLYGVDNAGEYIKKSYRGGWCYVVKGKENTIKHNGVTADVNSLYPSMMSSESGNVYPIGHPTFWYGNIEPEKKVPKGKYYFVTLRTRFKIKNGYLPFIQIKCNHLYRSNECLTSSDVYDENTKRYYDHYYDFEGNLCDTFVTLTLTMTDYILFKEHYDLIEPEILSGCWFDTELGIFDDYINKYKKIKVTTTGAKRELAKLFLNNLYGKMAANKESSFKVGYEKEDGSIGYLFVPEYNKKAGYIPVGSAITSYARNFTIRTAQKNYYGENKRGFIYADTDSIHCDLSPEELKGVKVHPVDFCCWKLESCWDDAIFTRQKTYIEHITKENLEPVNPYYNVKCAGLPEKCKNLFLMSMCGYTDEEYNDLTPEEQEFVKTKRTIEDFKVGLCIPAQLKSKTIRGGTVLVESEYKMRANGGRFG